jgi:hypothetical protein
MARIRIDPLGDLAAQSHAVLAAVKAAGHGHHEAVWDAASYSYEVPDDAVSREVAPVVVEAPTDEELEPADEPDEAETIEPDQTPEPAAKTRGRAAKSEGGNR